MKKVLSPEMSEKMIHFTLGSPSKSESIRRLARAGFERADIARFLNVRYQYVRNVLVREETKRMEGATEGLNDQPADPYAVRTTPWARVSEGGRVALPADMRRALSIAEGDEVRIELEADGIRIIPRHLAYSALRDKVARYMPDDVSLVDDLLAERRRETGGNGR